MKELARSPEQLLEIYSTVCLLECSSRRSLSLANRQASAFALLFNADNGRGKKIKMRVISTLIAQLQKVIRSRQKLSSEIYSFARTTAIYSEIMSGIAR